MPKMIPYRHKKRYGCLQYEVRDTNGAYVGWLSKVSNRWTFPGGVTKPVLEWELDIDIDAPIRINDNPTFSSFKEAKEWIDDNVA